MSNLGRCIAFTREGKPCRHNALADPDTTGLPTKCNAHSYAAFQLKSNLEGHPDGHLPESEFPGAMFTMRDGSYRCQTWCYMGVDSVYGGQCSNAATHDESTRCEAHSAEATESA